MIDVNDRSSEQLLLLGTVPPIDSDSPHLYQVNGEEIVVVRHAGTWSAFVNRCPHAGAPLNEGVSDDGSVVCGRHGWTFDLATGERIGNWSGGSKFALEMRSIVEQNGCLYLLQSRKSSEAAVGSVFLVRYGIPGWVAKFRGPESSEISLREKVLVQTERGIEEGELLSVQQREKHLDSMGELLRALTESDSSQRMDLKRRAETALVAARRLGSQRMLPQEFVDAEALWDGKTVIVYYLGEHGLELADLADSLSRELE
ncbi:MAG: Rieske 2Fe-2S domain-containing protein, partial [Planctomycetaceae bacterium]|nr:Rieske 2Fe-2S domain-containing protein [Planctomycetaceae bacterium]